MVKTKRKAGKRGTTADRDGLRARKSGVSKSGKPGLRKLKPAKTDPRTQKSSLPSETARLKRQLKTARMQQEASAEIFRAVANASGDAAGPLQLIAETTARLFKASSVSIQLAEGSEFTQEYRVGAMAKRVGSAYPRSNIKVGGRNLPGTVVAESRQIHIPDLDQLDSSMSDFPGLTHARAGGARTVCGTPLRREHTAIGALIVFRDRLLPFTDDELALLQSFADQAVIAIQNARLFNETKEALERQVATADILRIISRSVAHAAPVFDTILESCQRLFNPYDAAIYLVEGDRVRGVARRGPGVGDWGGDSMPLAGSSTGLAIAQRRPLHFPDLADKADLPEDKRDAVRLAGGMSVLYAPIVSESRGVGSLVVTRRPKRPFTETEIEFIQSFADQAAIAIENARLFNETQEALERQTATSEILRVISQSPTDVQPVFNAVVATAVRLFRRNRSFIVRCDGATYWPVALAGPDGLLPFPDLAPEPIDRDANFPSRAIVTGKNLHLPDWSAIDLPEYERQIRDTFGFNSALYLPLLREGQCIGVLGIAGTRAGRFDDDEIALAESFRDQALIAIENTRLFNETQEALARQTASSEILKVISQSPTDVQPVFDAIVLNAARLLRCDRAFIQRCDSRTYSSLAAAGPEGALPLAMQVPLPLDPDASFPARAMVTKKTLHVPDWSAVDLPDYERQIREVLGYNSALYMPLLRNDECVGLLGVAGARPNIFGVKEIALAESFRDQALIAIENTQLFNETQEALERQTATADILKVLASSPSDVHPVFVAIANSANRLIGGFSSAVCRVIDDLVHLVAFTPTNKEADAALQAMFPLHRNEVPAIDLMQDGKTAQIADSETADEQTRRHGRARGWRSITFTPLVSQGAFIGYITCTRRETGVLADHHVQLLQTFAAQAVIAIENARLFNETREALERQTATADILKVIASSPSDVQPVFEAIAERSNRLVGGLSSAVYAIVEDVLHLMAFTRTSPEADAAIQASFPRPLSEAPWADQIRKGEIVEIPDAEIEWADHPALLKMVRLRGFRCQLLVPLLRDGTTVGLISVTRKQPGTFAPHHVQLLQSFADQAVIAIENVRLFDEVQNKTRDLGEALEQQTATADVLKVISRSAFDLDSVMHTLARSAAELCAAGLCGLYIREGDFLVCRGYTAAISKEQEEFVRQARIPAYDPNFATTRVLSSGEIVNIGDFKNDRSVATQAFQEKLGFKSLLIVPLMREGQGIGLFILGRDRVGQFSPRHVELVQTFADQAVIAIENARLFDEVQARTRDLGEALEQQTATSAVLAVISRSPADLNPVLEAISDTAARLCGSEQTMFFRYDGNVFRILASWNFPPEVHEMLERRPLRPGHPSAIGRAGASLKPVCIPDVLADPAYGLTGEQSRARYRATLAVPLLREGQLVGALSLNRSEPGAFTEKQIELVATFADQAVIAIENTRLFNETREALERQTATADILKVIASSPDDVQPVFQAIAERSNHLVGGFATTVVSIIDDVVHLSAFTPTTPAADAALRAFYPRPLTGFSYSDAIGHGEIHRIVDSEVELAGESDQLAMVRQRGWRSALWVPLLLEGEAIGVIGVTRVEPGPFADHHVDMLKTFADQAVIAISNVKLFRQVQERTRELSQSLDDLRTAQDRLVQTEKLASLGQLTAGIAHEIKNPLNFVNNFSALSVELIDEMTEIFDNQALDDAGRRKELDEIRELLKSNLEKVVQHGKRADSIVKNMLLHSREGSGEQRAVDINALLDESLNLAYHGARAEKPGFNITLQRDLDPDAGVIELFPQEITRALLNLISNGFYAASKREAENGEAAFEPVLSAATKNLGNHIEIRIRDNGTGIPPEVKEKMFNPFFTTKPAGEGTGLGLSMSHDIIVKQHGGRIEVDTQPGQFTEFTIVLPRATIPANNRKN